MSAKITIKEIAELFDITTNKVRFYEKKGLITAQRGDNNYRYYTKEEVYKLQTILTYRLLNFSIEDIKDIFEENHKDNILDHLNKQWKIINEDMSRLRLLRNSIEGLMDDIYSVDDEDKYVEKISESMEQMKKCKNIQDNWRDRWNFDSWAKGYDESVRRDCGGLKLYANYEEALKTVYDSAVQDLAKDVKDIDVLDIGVGTGNLSEKFLSKGFNVVGIDQSREMMNQAKIKFPKLKLRMGEFLKIPYDNKQFDIIVTTYAFHHLNDEEKFYGIDEMIRVLKEDGKIVIGDMMFENEEQRKVLYKTLSKEQIESIEDEYYSYIDKLRIGFEKHNKSLTVKKIDEIFYVVTAK